MKSRHAGLRTFFAILFVVIFVGTSPALAASDAGEGDIRPTSLWQDFLSFVALAAPAPTQPPEASHQVRKKTPPQPAPDHSDEGPGIDPMG